MRVRFLVFVFLLAGNTVCAAPQISIGSKKFTESYVLSDIAKTLLEQAGFDVTHQAGMGGSIILWQALLHGDISLYPEYTGTIAEDILKIKEPVSLEAMRAALAEHGVGMTKDLGFNDGYALAMRRDQAAQLGIKTISGLKNHPELRAGLTPEFLGRQDGWRQLLLRYGLHFDSVRAIEHGLGYAALRNNQIDLKDAYTTDAKIGEYDLAVLKDDLRFFPQYEAVFLYRLDTPPKAVDAIRALEGRIDEAKMIELNSKAEQSKDYAAAAAAFFKGKDNVPAAPHQRNFLSDIPRLTTEHLTLVGVSLLAAILVSIPLGVIASRPGLLSQLILGTAAVIQTIPSLALLALMIPLFGVGPKPAIVALFLYSLLPIIRNTAVGLETIPQPLHEAANALGLRAGTQLWKIYLPMAMPSILAGIKTSAVINVGNATLAGLIGGGGFGEPIQSGLQLNDNATILEGAIPAAILALLVQFAFGRLDYLLVSKGLRLRPETA
jgi:osmoprotectant transport system permease protein